MKIGFYRPGHDAVHVVVSREDWKWRDHDIAFQWSHCAEGMVRDDAAIRAERRAGRVKRG